MKSFCLLLMLFSFGCASSPVVNVVHPKKKVVVFAKSCKTASWDHEKGGEHLIECEVK